MGEEEPHNLKEHIYDRHEKLSIRKVRPVLIEKYIVAE